MWQVMPSRGGLARILRSQIRPAGQLGHSDQKVRVLEAGTANVRGVKRLQLL